MPELNGIDAAFQLQKILPSAKLVFVTQQIDPQYLRTAFRAGGVAYVAKQSQRQREVLQLVAEGRTVKEISVALQISPKTVEFHKNALMNEIGCVQQRNSLAMPSHEASFLASLYHDIVTQSWINTIQF